MSKMHFQSPKAPAGLKYLGEKDIKCAGCNKTIAILLKAHEDTLEQKFKALCPCGDESFIVKWDGQLMVSPAEGYSIADFDSDNGITIIKIVKEK